nr:uncharacterized protein LOC129282612 [Lytechinus pictus]
MVINRNHLRVLLAILAQKSVILLLMLGNERRRSRSYRLDGNGVMPPTVAPSSPTLCRHRLRAHRHRLYQRSLLQLAQTFDIAMQTLEAGLFSNQRLYQRLERPGVWWEMAWASFSSSQWKENFRLSHPVFQQLVEEFRDYIQKDDSKWQVITTEKRVAITLWRLATPNTFRCISQLFGIGRSRAWEITHDVCRAIWRILPRHLKFPTANHEYLQVKTGFVALGMLQAIGAIDGTHIQIKAPVENKNDYFNQKGFFNNNAGCCARTEQIPVQMLV